MTKAGRSGKAHIDIGQANGGNEMIKWTGGVVQNRLRRCDCKAKEIDVFEQASMKARLIRVVLQRAVTGHRKYSAAVLQAVQPQVELREMQFGSEWMA